MCRPERSQGDAGHRQLTGLRCDVPIVDLPAGPYDMPSLIGRDIIYDFALFMEHSADRLHLLRTAEEIIPLLES